MYATRIDLLGAVADIRDGALGLGRGVRALYIYSWNSNLNLSH